MSPTGSPKQLAPGDVFAGKYRLERQVASGGMGFVWRAWNTQLDIPVAIKVMAASVADSPDFVARFELEAKVAAQVRNPHVVSIYEHGVHEGLPYMVMELLEGEDLSQRLKRERRLTMVATAHIVRDMCKALHRAHELAIVHRDIKPANVFLCRHGDEDLVKVLDFGIAKRTLGGRELTATGEMMGTPSYMSPEHIRASKHVDHRADLWSVSVIAYRALSGQLPFTGQILDVVDGILNSAAPAPSTFAPDLSPAVDAFFARALARNLDDRFQSARDLSEALGKLVGRESLVAPMLFTAAPVEQVDEPVPSDRRPTMVKAPLRAAVSAPEAEAPEGNTVLLGGRGSQAAFNASSGAGPRSPHLRTLPLDDESKHVAAKALAEARSRVAAAAPPSPWGRPASRAVAASPPRRSRRRSWSWWVVLASALVIVAAALWATIHHAKSAEPAPAAPPAASAQ
jgi:serine/threonine-protein kinase